MSNEINNKDKKTKTIMTQQQWQCDTRRSEKKSHSQLAQVRMSRAEG